ncbi:MAG: SufE family protein [Verrucomicrobiota bacterium JB022]|nr:SufE family protein [Verrucomicrobiota bacterium JB022]
MTIREKENQLIEELNLIPDAQERLSYVVELGTAYAPLPEALRQDAFRVRGCQSAVWIVPQAEGARFAVDADSSIVKGIACLLGDIYSVGTPQEAAAHESQLLAQTRIDAHLSPNRRRGLQLVAARLRELAGGLA